MSLDATIWAWKQRGLTPAEKTVLLSLADRAGEDHTAWPSAKRLAKDTELSDRHVRRVLKQLRSKRKIRPVGEHFSGVIIYQLIGVSGREEEIQPPRQYVRGVMTPRHEGPDSVSAKPSIEPPIESNTPRYSFKGITQKCFEQARQRFSGYDIHGLEAEWLG
ncbi:MAG: hypothetical protein COB46_04280 [Rhodospirillaceae bacterium]|nr:MAG: hypothetical protein COB46_04280 [Rhodospirillaceae bacterium]